MTAQFLQSLLPGESLSLRGDKLRYMKTRKWNYLKKLEKNKSILLLHKSKGYMLEGKEEDIDWKAYQKAKGRRNPPFNIVLS